MQNFFNKEDSFRLGKIILILGLFLSLYVMMKFINEVRTFQTIGSAVPSENTIDVSGEGDASAVPDVATISFSVSAQGKTVDAAQSVVSTKINQALDFLKTSNVDSADIQTTNYNTYPEYNSNSCAPGMFCPATVTTAPQIIDYKAEEDVSVKIRTISDAGTIVDGLGAAGITGISGPDFSIDNPDAVQAQARQKAIDDAKQKAIVLANQLGLHLGKITHFSDQGVSPMPVMYAAKAMDVGSAVAAPTTALPTGENKYTSDVTITYEVY